jgi:hypothetical protein
VLKFKRKFRRLKVNTNVYGTFYKFYITGLKMTKLGQNMLP